MRADRRWLRVASRVLRLIVAFRLMSFGPHSERSLCVVPALRAILRALDLGLRNGPRSGEALGTDNARRAKPPHPGLRESEAFGHLSGGQHQLFLRMIPSTVSIRALSLPVVSSIFSSS